MIKTVLATIALLFAILIAVFWAWILSMDYAFMGGTNFSLHLSDWVKDPAYFASRFGPPIVSAALVFLTVWLRKNSKGPNARNH